MSDTINFKEVGDFSKQWKKARGTISDLDRLKKDIERVMLHNSPIYVNVREIRARLGNTGKSGGARVTYFFHDDARNVYLFACYDRHKFSGFTKDELKQLNKLCEQVISEYRE